MYRVAEISSKREADKMSGAENMVDRIAIGAHVAFFLSRLVRDSDIKKNYLVIVVKNA